ncbi:hypothetical protein QR680_014571 [Steinernema hermaphroditum]|uniref:Uncharacterized protein n=1 Tax=Steinernema hermaphroditum TaxID=289476 RepID=A0AA39M3F4_9BILA|nr:hypothetical protein QR680_014571 [Steinernema hermaphroditum]
MARLIAALFALAFIFAVVECRSEELPFTARGKRSVQNDYPFAQLPVGANGEALPPGPPRFREVCNYNKYGRMVCEKIVIKG